MTGTDLALRQAELVRLDTEQIKFLAHTEFVNDRIRGNLPAIFATIATGREIGIGDMAALRHIHMIDGKPGYSAEIMVARVHDRGHKLDGEVGPDKAVARGRRKDTGAEMTFTYTLEMAEQAGLLGKQNWRKHPQSMLWARAASQLCRMLFPDCMAGATYTAEELEDTVGEPSADIPGIEAATASAASAAQDSQASRPASPTVDMDDPDIPFGNAPLPEPEPITGPQKKKLNVLVGKLRPEYVSTEELWRMCDRPPKVSEDGEVHWSPLRDQLRKGEASRLIEQLNTLEVQATEDRLVAYAAEHGNEDTIVQLIDQKRQDLDLEAFAVWIRKQGANLDAKLKAETA